jgi:hypothetical protein
MLVSHGVDLRAERSCNHCLVSRRESEHTQLPGKDMAGVQAVIMQEHRAFGIQK